jgi:uncharacterized protein YneF (UPF0154 family)
LKEKTGNPPTEKEIQETMKLIQKQEGVDKSFFDI